VSKYKAEPVIIGGIRFDSKKEAARGFDLQMLQKAGQISDLKFQVPFILQEEFVRDGKTERAIKYLADATYIENGKLIVEDTKSAITKGLPVYRMKRKMLLYKYPEIILRENI
jgi:hypothetical protein